MGLPANMWITDESGQQIKGSCTIKGRENSINVIEIEHNITLPFDADTGKVTATRKHAPIGILKKLDQSSPYLSKACCDGRTLKEIKINLYQINEQGHEEAYYKFVLENAKVVSYSPIITTTNSRIPHLDHVAFSYEVITQACLNGNFQTQDSWYVRS